jgi:hypothetical protein
MGVIEPTQNVPNYFLVGTFTCTHFVTNNHKLLFERCDGVHPQTVCKTSIFSHQLGLVPQKVRPAPTRMTSDPQVTVTWGRHAHI